MSKTKYITIENIDCFVKHTNPFQDFVNDRKIFSSPCNKLYRKDIIIKQSFIEGIYFEDWPFITEVFAHIPFYITTEIPCYVYRESNASTIRSAFTMHKVESYLTGIQHLYTHFQNSQQLRLAQKRMAVAMKMLINKTYKAKDKDLKRFVYQECVKLIRTKVIRLFDLPIKTLFRLWRLK